MSKREWRLALVWPLMGLALSLSVEACGSKPDPQAFTVPEATSAGASLNIPGDALYYRPHGYLPPMTQEKRAELMREYGEERLVRAAADGEEFGRYLRTNRRLVFVVENGEPLRREIVVGRTSTREIEVLSGLQPGEVIMVGTNTEPES